MRFDIAKVVLWPKDQRKALRVVEFASGRLNVISGVSRTGKSAIIPIIDYCLGSDRCTIPTGVIRETTAWFGVVVRTTEGEKLFARREPEAQQTTDDMFIAEAAGEMEIPAAIPRKMTKDSAKQRLDQLAGLTKLSFSPDDPEGGLGRPSFRDLVAFVFQPQNIVANPNVLFYKADTQQHRDKLRSIFPYVLGAISAETLAKRHQLQQLQRELRRKEHELANIAAVSERWRATAQARLAEARELGLLKAGAPAGGDYQTILASLREVAASPRPNVNVTSESLTEGVTELNLLNDEEELVAQELSTLRRRFAEMEALRSNAATYKTAIHVQRDRLQVSRWLRGHASGDHECPVCGSEMAGSTERLESLTSSLEDLERVADRIDTVPPSFDREMERVRMAVDQHVQRLSGIKIRQTALESQSQQVRKHQYSAMAASRFMGRLESDLKTLDSVGEDGVLRAEVEGLRERVGVLERQVSEAQIAAHLRRALQVVNLNAGRLIPLLDAERPDSPVSLSDTELTVRVHGSDRDDYLWEIGSGSNWLSYHIALTLALQEYFISQRDCPVPSFLVYDQPSQVYFPRRLADRPDEIAEEPVLRDKDVEAVRRILAGMASAIERTGGALQIIVLDHASESVWKNTPLIHPVADWRDEEHALIPRDWIRNS